MKTSLWFGILCVLALSAIVVADDEERTPEEREKARQRRWGTPGYGAPRQPGSLLLNMLVKNERDHLDRTLPKWAKVIDAWIIGVDDKNSDDSVEVIQKHLGHIPGHIVIIHFDGMGPTWSVLVQHGIDHFPQITHGIIADADFAPMKDHLNRMELDIRCSKHMYTIWTQDHRNERRMDWIYRNVQGAKVKRRTHQTVEAPEFPDQEVFQTLIDLPIDEREGGYQDRTPGKNKRYIQFLEDDLVDYPGDTRTLYYLGYAHYDNFKKAFEAKGGKPDPEDWKELEKGIDYMNTRIASTDPDGNKEEKWFTMLKLGEVYERYYRNWPKAERWYRQCTEDDPDRADAWFYLGQHYRLAQQPEQALEPLKKAATLEVPDRSLFQWHFLYYCLSKLEYGRALNALSKPTLSQLKEGRNILKLARCQAGDPGNAAEIESIKDSVRAKISELRGKKGGKNKVKVVKKALATLNKNIDDLDEELSDVVVDGVSLFTELKKRIDSMQAFVDKFKGAKKRKENIPCRAYRRATTPYLRLIKAHKDAMSKALEDDPFMSKVIKQANKIRNLCR